MTEFKYGDDVVGWDDNPRVTRPGKFLCKNDLGKCDFPYIIAIEILGRSEAMCFSHCRKARPNIAIDTPMWFKDKINIAWARGYFAGWDEDGNPRRWNNGRGSHTALNDTDYAAYEQYSLTDPNIEAKPPECTCSTSNAECQCGTCQTLKHNID